MSKEKSPIQTIQSLHILAKVAEDLEMTEGPRRKSVHSTAKHASVSIRTAINSLRMAEQHLQLIMTEGDKSLACLQDATEALCRAAAEIAQNIKLAETARTAEMYVVGYLGTSVTRIDTLLQSKRRGIIEGDRFSYGRGVNDGIEVRNGTSELVPPTRTYVSGAFATIKDYINYSSRAFYYRYATGEMVSDANLDAWMEQLKELQKHADRYDNPGVESVAAASAN